MYNRNSLMSNQTGFSTSVLSNKTNQNVCLTLPITCQICLGKVKEPCVCPNLHAFCAYCIEIWLEKSNQCPSCRTPINKENPCRRILGGIENLDDVDMLKPTDFSHSSARKARFMNLFQQYEDEIMRLNKFIDTLNNEVSKLKDSNNSNNFSNVNTGPQHELLNTLKSKLQAAQSNLDESISERDKLRESNKKMESENSILMQEIARLKATLNEKTSQMTSRFTIAALESKIESYEKEIKQLQKALDKSDKYIAELESKSKQDNSKQNRPIFTKENINSQEKQSMNAIISKTNNMNSSKFSKPDINSRNDPKIVKFSEKIDTIPNSCNNSITSPPTANISNKQHVIITNDKFYGSPSKSASTTPISGPGPAQPIVPPSSLMSFTDRLKKSSINTPNNASSFDLEAPSPLSQSLISTVNQSSHNITAYNENLNQNQNHQFLFSPMKRLRLDEITLERPSFYADESVNNTTSNLNEVSPVRILDMDSKKTIIKSPSKNLYHANIKNKDSENDYEMSSELLSSKKQQSLSESSALLNASTSEFIDCIQLLNEAEKKVQTKQASPTTLAKMNMAGINSNYYASSSSSSTASSIQSNQNSGIGNMMQHNNIINNNNNNNNSNSYNTENFHSYGLSDKYFRPATLFDNNNCLQNDNTSSRGSNHSSTSPSSCSSGNSLSATIPTGASSLISSIGVSSSSSLHSFSNGNMSNSNMSFLNPSSNGSFQLKKIPSFEQNMNNQNNNYQINTNNKNEIQSNQNTGYAQNSAVNRSRSVEPLYRNS